jgi:hypothetical protein
MTNDPAEPSGSTRLVSRKPAWVEPATAFAAVMTALILGIGLWFTNQANRETAEAARQQQRLAMQSELSDRFTRSIDQLGSTQLDIRVGGVFGLERLIKDSPDDQATIVEVLAAFLRTNAPATDNARKKWSPTPPKPRSDVQAALTVLGRQPSQHYTAPNLTKVDLTGADLSGSDFHDAIFTGAYLAFVDMRNSDLSGIHCFCTVEGARLSGANLSYAVLFASRAAYADFKGANLQHADLSSAYLIGAEFSGADLRGADLSGATVYGKMLAGAVTNAQTKLPPGLNIPSSAPTASPS